MNSYDPATTALAKPYAARLATVVGWHAKHDASSGYAMCPPAKWQRAAARVRCCTTHAQVFDVLCQTDFYHRKGVAEMLNLCDPLCCGHATA